MRPVSVALLAASLWLVPPPSPAQACSPPSPWPGARRVLPADGMQGVATNSRVVLGLNGQFLTGYRVQLRVQGGAVIASAQDGGGIELDAPLAPGTTYELLDNVTLPCEPDLACFGDSLVVVSSFTTGSGPDTTPPVFPAAPFVRSVHHEVCLDSACCGPYDSVLFVLDWEPATDDSPILFYDVSKEGGSDGAVSIAGSNATGELSCGEGSDPLVDLHAGNGTYVIHAHDLAGNVASSLPVVVDLACSDLARDGGPGHSCDGGGPPHDTPDPHATGGGCDIGAGSRPGSRAAGLLALVGLVLAWRRRPLRARRGRSSLAGHVLHRP